MRIHPVKLVGIISCVGLIIGVCLINPCLCQESGSSSTGSVGSSGIFDSPLTSNSNHATATDSRIEELKALIEPMAGRKLSRDEVLQLKQLRFELRVAQGIASQLGKIRPTREKGERQAKPQSGDTFVIAKIEVAPQSKVADVTFGSITGELENTNDLFDYLKATPQGGFRDYRIVSRHDSGGGAEQALAVVRNEYDLYKEREQQMLAYIAARNKQLASIRQSRRC